MAAGATVELAGICYNKVIQADPLSAWPMGLGRELHFSCGRSGHCVGGLWFHIWDSGKSCFYSGDYQPGPLAFAVDQEMCIRDRMRPMQDRWAWPIPE